MPEHPERERSVSAADGVRLRVLLSAPPHPSGMLLLCHGLSTDANEHGAFPALRDQALRLGLGVVRFDFRAHGQSGGTNQELRLAGMRADVDAVVGLVDEAFGEELPVIPLGVSFGGGPAVHAAATRRRCAGLALWYPVVDYEWNYGERSTVRFTQQMRAAKHPADPDWSAMPVLGTAYHLPAELLREIRYDRTPATLAGFTLPVLAHHGSRDTFVDAGPLRSISAASPNIELRTAHGAGHGFVLWRRLVIRRTVSWAASVVRAAREMP
jgi:pimeloyl-ACP methyl ester carboxylesterase